MFSDLPNQTPAVVALPGSAVYDRRRPVVDRSAVIDRRYNKGGSVSLGRGRRTSSPLQFGHMAAIARVHSAQNVHS
jgi:hypothetical protein